MGDMEKITIERRGQTEISQESARKSPARGQNDLKNGSQTVSTSVPNYSHVDPEYSQSVSNTGPPKRAPRAAQDRIKRAQMPSWGRLGGVLVSLGAFWGVLGAVLCPCG